MRQLRPEEQDKAQTFFNAERPECKACRYTAKVQGRIKCGMLEYDCIVTKPVCLEMKQ